MKERKTPTRSCIGCGAARDKRELCRVVRTPEGHVEIDVNGKAGGRGAYVCIRPQCFETAVARRKLGSALRIRLQPDDFDRLRKEFDVVCADHRDQDA